MGVYRRFVLPRLVNFACGLEPAMRQREKVVPLARGRVLEVGLGSGLNLPFYDSAKVTKVLGLEPSAEMIRMAERAAAKAPFAVELLQASANAIPLDDKAADTVLTTYTLCTVPDAACALSEMSRVLRPGGKLIFCEHGAAPDASVRAWQDRLTPVWRRFSGGCELNRTIPALIEGSGFRIETIDAMYLPGWRPASFTYWGTATLR